MENRKKWIKCFLCAFLAGFMILGFNFFSKINYSQNYQDNAYAKIKKEIKLNTKKAIKQKILKEARNQGLNPLIALSVAKQESDFEKKARSSAGAIGVFQLMPATAKDLRVNPYKTEENIKGGIKYLKALKTQFGSTKLALAAYNAGPGAVQRYGGVPPYGETRTYVKNILSYYEQYKNNPNSVLVE